MHSFLFPAWQFNGQFHSHWEITQTVWKRYAIFLAVENPHSMLNYHLHASITIIIQVLPAFVHFNAIKIEKNVHEKPNV